MLWLIELIGGTLLAALLFKKTAWYDAAAVGETVAAGRRKIRQVAGTLAIGLLLGYRLNKGLPDVLSVFPDPSSKAWVYFVGIPLLLVVITLFLSRLRKEF